MTTLVRLLYLGFVGLKLIPGLRDHALTNGADVIVVHLVVVLLPHGVNAMMSSLEISNGQNFQYFLEISNDFFVQIDNRV